MTTEQAIDNAALDAELAETLFGWIWRQETGKPDTRFWLDPKVRLYSGLIIPEERRLSAPPAYSTTGDGMDRVAQKLRARGLSVTITYIPEGEPYHGGEVECVIYRQAEQLAIGWHVEAATAVALAGISALRGGEAVSAG